MWRRAKGREEEFVRAGAVESEEQRKTMKGRKQSSLVAVLDFLVGEPPVLEVLLYLLGDGGGLLYLLGDGGLGLLYLLGDGAPQLRIVQYSVLLLGSQGTQSPGSQA